MTTGQLQTPLLIGISGHCDLLSRDTANLEGAVNQVMSDLQRRHTLTLLSSLAEGADRLVAKVALELGIDIIVPLPMTTEDFTRDFQFAASKAEFAEIAARSKDMFVVPLACQPRDDGYLAATVYVVEHCDILIALWDGKPSDKVGGTADAVRRKLESYGRVIQIVTPRQSHMTPIKEPFVIHILNRTA